MLDLASVKNSQREIGRRGIKRQASYTHKVVYTHVVEALCGRLNLHS